MATKELNLGILAHVDAGKTTLTERLLYEAGVIDQPGSVDAGTTQTDSLALERQRGITIRSAVASFALGDLHVNLIDTPGHPDFIAEVERVLNVLDGAVLVLSGVEGVQPQTRILMRALQRLRIPTLLFVNKLDRPGADAERVLRDISERLTTAAVPIELRGARLAELLAERDEEIMAAYVEDEAHVPSHLLQDALAAQTRRALVHPVLFGSAVTGDGLESLRTGITGLLPAADGEPEGPVSATVFKIERGANGEKIAYVRMFSGTIRVRERLHFGRGLDDKVTAITVFEQGGAVQRPEVAAGGVAKLWGLAGIQIGDHIGDSPATGAEHHFPPPTLESVVSPAQPDDGAALRAALAQLAEQDPLIDVRQDDTRGELSVSLYGEVQKEVIQATLADEFGLDVTFRETTPIYIERPVGSGEAIELLHAESNPYLATIGLRIDPAPSGVGIDFRLQVDPRTTPLYVYKTLDGFAERMGQYVRDALHEGPLRLAGHRLRRDDDPLHLQRPRRPAVAPGAAQHGGGLPQADAARRRAGARTGRHRGVRADRPGDRRAAARRDRRAARRPGTARCRGRDAVAAREARDDRNGAARDAGPGAPAAAPRPDERRGRARLGLRRVPAGER